MTFSCLSCTLLVLVLFEQFDFINKIDDEVMFCAIGKEIKYPFEQLHCLAIAIMVRAQIVEISTHSLILQ